MKVLLIMFLNLLLLVSCFSPCGPTFLHRSAEAAVEWGLWAAYYLCLNLTLTLCALNRFCVPVLSSVKNKNKTKTRFIHLTDVYWTLPWARHWSGNKGCNGLQYRPCRSSSQTLPVTCHHVQTKCLFCKAFRALRDLPLPLSSLISYPFYTLF